ncbi:uncharacterized protein LOC117291257 isoform X2 [Asterias rubens]|uniref:uncharacterized protein LOC117291257 isoform X2 n=1 Tax=Asterias rubens TaxID=7604 RepID=UPI001455255B|nr:uncharacterized protein LOC117291257 isoform X2 [Asterias rubens]
MAPPKTILIELGIEPQSDCGICTIDASKSCGLDLELRPLSQRWEQSPESELIFRRIPEEVVPFGPVRQGPSGASEPRSRKGVCSTCSEPCARCSSRAEPQIRPHGGENGVPAKRYLSCAFFDTPSSKTYRMDIEFPTAHQLDFQSTPQETIAEKDGMPCRISNISFDHDDSTPVEVDLQLDKGLDLSSEGWSSASRSSQSSISTFNESKPTSDDESECDEKDSLKCSYSSHGDTDEADSRPFDNTQLGREGSDTESDSASSSTEHSGASEDDDELSKNAVSNDDELSNNSGTNDDELPNYTVPNDDESSDNSVPNFSFPSLLKEDLTYAQCVPDDLYDSLQGDTEPEDIFDELCLNLTPEAADQMMMIKAMFSDESPPMTPLEPQPFSLLTTEPIPSHTEETVQEELKPTESSVQETASPPATEYSFSDSLDLTPAEFEQFMAMNAAFGGPVVFPPPKIAPEFPSFSAKTSSTTPSQPKKVSPTPDPALSTKLRDLLETDPLEPDLVKRSTDTSEPIPTVESYSLSDSLDITPEEYEQFAAMNAAFGGPSVIPPPRMTFKEVVELVNPKVAPARPTSLDIQVVTSPDLTRKSSVSTTSSANPEDNPEADEEGTSFWADCDDTVLIKSSAEPTHDSSDSLVASSQEDEGSLTPQFEQPPKTFDTEVNGDCAPVTTDQKSSGEENKTTKGPLFIEELLLTSASGEGHGENSVLMRCKIDAWPAPTVSWFYKDEPLGDGNEAVDPDRVVLKSDGARGVFTLLLKEVEGFDTGVYTCKASNIIGEATSAAELIVQESVSDSEYETARSYFTSGDEIVDNLGESWLARGRGVNRNRLPGRMVPERTVRITTHRASAPRFTFKPQSRVVEIGQTARLICGVRGSPKPRVSWFNHGTELKNEGRYRVLESEDGNSVLEIREVESLDTGSYICTAGNIIGQIYCTTELSVEEFGEPEIDVKTVDADMSLLPVQYLQYGLDARTEEEEKEAVSAEAPPAEGEASPVVPQRVLAMEGTTATLDCSLVEGRVTSSVTWFKDGTSLDASPHCISSVDEDRLILNIPQTALEDEGEYTCCLTDAPDEVLCCCILMVHEEEANANDGTDSISSRPFSSTPKVENAPKDKTRPLELNKATFVRKENLEARPKVSPVVAPDKGSRKVGHRTLGSVDYSDSSISSSSGNGEDAVIRRREKQHYATPRKHKDHRKSRKSNRSKRSGGDGNQLDIGLKQESDSSEDTYGRTKTPTHRSKPQKKYRSSFSSDLDDDFDDGLERVMALSDKADACLNIVNSVLEMTSFDKEVDDALQEQINAFRANVSESDGSLHQSENVDSSLVDSDTEDDFIKHMAAQTVASAIAEQMMRETDSLPVAPQPQADLPLTNGFAPKTKHSAKDDFNKTSDEEVAQEDMNLNLSVDLEPFSFTTTASLQETNSLDCKNGLDRSEQLDLSHSPESPRLKPPVDSSHSMSPRTCLFRGPQDKIFTLDEILDALPETAVDGNSEQSSKATSPVDKAQKFTLLECHSQPRSPSPVAGSPEGSPRTEFPTEELPAKDSQSQDSPPELVTQLQDTFILKGDAMRLEVQARGHPVPEVLWYKDGTELQHGKNLQLKFDGEDTWALITRNIKAQDGGVYTCVAENSLGSTSTSAVIAVAGLVDEPESADCDEDEDTVEAKESQSSSHGLSASSPTALDDDVFIVKPNSKDILPTILLNAEEDSTLSQSGEEDIREASSRVLEAIRLDSNANWADESSPDVSRSNSNNSDKGVPFSIQKRSRPESNIEIIRHRRAFRKNTSRDSTTSVEPSSTGNSTSDESDTEGAPKFIKALKTTEILEGESVQFEVCVTGDPEPKVRWYHDSSELKDTSHTKCRRVENTNVWRLCISRVRQEDDGKYMCRAENRLGVKACIAFLIVELLNGNEGDNGDENDKRIVSRLVKEKEDEQSFGESSQIEEDLLKSFTLESDYSDSSGRMSVKRGEQVELLDGRRKDKWLVRHKTNANMIGYIPCTLLKRSASSSEREDRKIVYNFVAKQSIEKRSRGKQKLNRHTSKDGQLSELEEGRIIDDFSDAEATQCYDLYMAVASYTPSAEQKGFIPMAENQVFEVLDSNSALNWLVRAESSPCSVGWVPASYLTPFVCSGHYSARRGSRSLRDDFEDISTEEEEQREVGSKEKEAMLKRGFVLKELLDTERDFVKDLRYVTTRFIPPIEHPNVPAALRGKKDDIFGNIKEIYDFHNSQFHHELEECENDANSIARAFIKWQSTFINLHVQYCKNKPKADNVLTPAAKAFFLQYGGGTGPGQLGLGDYLIKPVQRITKYQLLLKEIVKYTSRAKEDCSELEFALNVMIEVPKRANDLMHLRLIEGFQRDVTELGKLYRQDFFSAWSGKPKGRGKERYLFLFKDVLMFTKPRKELKGDVVGYVYKSHLIVGSLIVSEDMADERRFEISQGRSSTLTLQGKTKYMKEAWVKALRDLIAEVPKDLKEGKSSTERRLGLLGNMSKSTESLSSLMSSPSLLNVPRSGRGSVDSMMGSAEFSAFSALIPSVGSTYEVVEDMVAEGHRSKELYRGDMVKLLEVCDNNMFHVLTLPVDESSPGIEGYVSPGLVKKIGSSEEHPYFTERVKSRTVFADETAILTCSFLGKPSPTATWSLANHLSHDDKRLEFVTTEESSTLILYNTVIRDTGEYACTVENSSGSTCCSARLDVKGAYSTSSTPTDLEDVREGCTSSPAVSPTYPEPPLLVRSSSLENLTTLPEDFDVLPTEIIRASSVSGRGMLSSTRRASSLETTKEKIGSFRKHFKRAFSSVGAERDKILHNLQRAPSGGSNQRSKHHQQHQQQQKTTTCVHCKAERDDMSEDTQAVCEACAQKLLAGSRETLLEEEEDASVR